MKHELSERVTVRFTEDSIQQLDEVLIKLELKTRSELIRMLLSTIHERMFKIQNR